ncbi:MAG: putative 2-keto-3-deoxy-galactonate aldolase YagE [Verrucomicrobiota bacterium]|jgi:hypothetical protein
MSTTQSTINGIFVPNIVPYDAKGRIDEDELRHIIHWVGDKSVTGFYPNGSMGEFIRLSYEERRTVVRIVSEEANGRPILAGAAEANIELVLEMCKYCADLGCRAVSITGPYYYKLTQESIEAPFLSISAMLAQEAATAADVKIVGKEKIGAAYVTVIVSGDVAAVSAAIAAGKQAVGSLGKVIAAHVIARPHDELIALLPK